MNRQSVVPAILVAVESQPGDPEFVPSVTAALNQLSPEIEWIWLLEANVEIAPDTLERLVMRLELSPSAAMIGAKQLLQQDRSIISSLGISLSQFAEPLRLYAGEFDQGQHNSDSDVLAVDPNCSIASRSGLQSQLGALTDTPARAFGYELGMRLRAAGYRILVEPDARCWVIDLADAPSVSNQFGKLTARIQLSALVLPLAWIVALWLAAPLLVPISVAIALFKKLPTQALAAPVAIAWGWFKIPQLLRSRASFRSVGDTSVQKDFWLGRSAVRKLRMVQLAQVEIAIESRIRLFESGIVWWSLVPLLASYQLLSLGVPRTFEFPPLSHSLAELVRTAFTATQPYWQGVPIAADPISWVWLLFGLLSPSQPGIAIGWFIFLAPTLCFLLTARLMSEFTHRKVAIILLSLCYALNPLLTLPLLQGNAAGALFLLVLPVGALALIRVFRLSYQLNWSSWAFLGLTTFIASALYPVFGGIWSLAIALAVVFKRPKLISAAALALAPSFILILDYLIELLGSGAAWLSTWPLFPEITQLAGFWLVPLALVLLVWGLGVARLNAWEAITAATLALATATWFWSAVVAQALLAASLVTALVAIAIRDAGSPPNVKRATLTRLTSKIAVASLGASALLGGIALTTERPKFQSGDSSIMPALVAASAEVDPNVRTLVIDLSENQTSAELIWNDGRNLDEVSLILEHNGAQFGLDTKQLTSRLVAGLIAGNSQVTTPALDELKVAYILVIAPSPEVTRSLSTISGLASSGLTEFGELWRNTDYQISAAPPISPTLIQWTILALLAILSLLAIPKPRLARRSSAESPIFDEVSE